MKRYIFAIDTAYANNGSCLAEAGKMPAYVDRANLLVTGNGEVYSSYEEQHSFEYTYKYVVERIQTMQAAQLCIIEKAMITDDEKRFVRDPSESMRANVVLERNLYAIMSTFHIMGYLPPVLVVPPSRWQKVLGIPTMSYKEHKLKACEMFTKMTSPAFVESIKLQYFDRKYDDIAEAYLITQAAHKEFDKWYEEATTYHNHNAHVSNFAAKIKKEQRMAQLPKITDNIKFVDGKTRFNWLVQYKRFQQDTKPKKPMFKASVLDAVKASTMKESTDETVEKSKKKPKASPVEPKEKTPSKVVKSKKKVKVITMSDEEEDCVVVINQDDSDLEF
jgi:hypothetical protein